MPLEGTTDMAVLLTIRTLLLNEADYPNLPHNAGLFRPIKIIAPPGLPETAQRAGRIPGAKNIPWGQAANEDGTFKSADELVELYGSKDITGDKDIVAYCRIGERSSHTWFVLRYLLGYSNVSNYDGSWTEWGNLVDAPTVTGPE